MKQGRVHGRRRGWSKAPPPPWQAELWACENLPPSSEFHRTAWQNWWTPPSLMFRWSPAPAPQRSIQRTPGRDSRQLAFLITPVSALYSRYQKISGDGRLLHSVEGALLRGAGLEVEYGLHNCLAHVRVPTSHHEELLVRVVTLRFLGARGFVNVWGLYGGVKAFRVAGVVNVGWVWGGLRTEKMSAKPLIN